jgi:hypothetical protein
MPWEKNTEARLRCHTEGRRRRIVTGMQKFADVVSCIGPLFSITIELTSIETSHDRIHSRQIGRQPDR